MELVEARAIASIETTQLQQHACFASWSKQQLLIVHSCVATNPTSWQQLLIKTGSAPHIIKLKSIVHYCC
jgi:hypothetical protein